VDLLAYSCLGLSILVIGAFLMLMVAASVSEYNLAKRVKRALISVSCPKCGGGPLAVTANPLFREAEGFRCCLRIPGRYAICRKCDSAFFAAPAGAYLEGIATPAGAFELTPIDAISLKHGLQLRETANRRILALVVAACLGLSVLYATLCYWGLPAADVVVLTVVVGLLLFGRRLPEFIVGRKQMGSQRTVPCP
jgi:hypothetical protein